MINKSDYNSSCIYKIYSARDINKVYIGRTCQYNIRFKRHKNDLNKSIHGNTYLQRIHNKYKDLCMEIIEICDRENLDTREVFWIEFYNSYEAGYNFTHGGNSCPLGLNNWTKERRLKQSKKLSENPLSKGVKRSDNWKTSMNKSVEKRQQLGIMSQHLNKKCTINGVLYKSIKDACLQNKISSYSYITKKLKINKIITYKNLTISINNHE